MIYPYEPSFSDSELLEIMKSTLSQIVDNKFEKFSIITATLPIHDEWSAKRLFVLQGKIK